jgi:hypothetical protein
MRQNETKYVYFMFAESGHAKIGVSRDPFFRLKNEIQSHNPFEIKVGAWIPCETKQRAFHLESVIHRHFDDERVRGEWFDLREDDECYHDALNDLRNQGWDVSQA